MLRANPQRRERQCRRAARHAHSPPRVPAVFCYMQLCNSQYKAPGLLVALHFLAMFEPTQMGPQLTLLQQPSRHQAWQCCTCSRAPGSGCIEGTHAKCGTHGPGLRDCQLLKLARNKLASCVQCNDSLQRTSPSWPTLPGSRLR